ncbi:hypothetical protein BJY00DRAFT_296178 [Aspergillus carlsbadensis]|nr:hypothetical protein BJY00DRAFT_296178 [Aspergillus carlsbadensis]
MKMRVRHRIESGSGSIPRVCCVMRGSPLSHNLPAEGSETVDHRAFCITLFILRDETSYSYISGGICEGGASRLF